MHMAEEQDVEEDNAKKSNQRKFLGIWFQCCHTYGRLYKNKKGTHYVGRCPRCLRSVQVRIDQSSDSATNRRFFSGS